MTFPKIPRFASPFRLGPLWRCRVLAAALGLSPCFVACSGSAPDGNGDTCATGQMLASATVSYQVDVRPILDLHGCLTSGCHGGLVRSSGLQLDDYAASFTPGLQATGLGRCNIVPGDADASYLFEKISSLDPTEGETMPLMRPMLSQDEIDLIRVWIEEGAQDN